MTCATGILSNPWQEAEPGGELYLAQWVIVCSDLPWRKSRNPRLHEKLKLSLLLFLCNCKTFKFFVIPSSRFYFLLTSDLCNSLPQDVGEGSNIVWIDFMIGMKKMSKMPLVGTLIPYEIESKILKYTVWLNEARYCLKMEKGWRAE